MAKLYYGPNLGTISVRHDHDADDFGNQIEITAEQALALAASNVALALNNLVDTVSDVVSAIRETAPEE
jgi:hypothetical protein